MSLMGDIAKEGVVQRVVSAIKKELETIRDPEAIKALKRVGRVALDELEFCFEEWPREYYNLFREE